MSKWHKTYIHAYICNDCATKKGAKWPEGHCATYHESICGYCNNLSGVCHISDWSWPKEPELNKYANSNREI